MMEPPFNVASILTRFDHLVHTGMVIYNDNFGAVTVSDQGLWVEFRILKGLTNKPLNPREPQAQEQPPGCLPGSDIPTAGYELATLGSTHFMTANKFPSARPHLLILTQDGFRRQHEALDLEDISAARHVMCSLEDNAAAPASTPTTTASFGRALMLFNCGIESGCSRMHKHLHVFPAPKSDTFRLWPDDARAQARLPFKAFVHRFEGGTLPAATAILGVYRDLLREAEQSVGAAPRDGGPAIPHNAVMDRNWLVVVPRRAAKWNGVGANAAAMLGMVWAENNDKMDAWMRLGPANVLRHVGFPADTCQP